jgi:hypothetical protein
MKSKNKSFADKHPQGTTVSETLLQTVRAHIDGQSISCDTAHRLAAELNVSLKEMGTAIDLQEARIRQCQLGLFGQDSGKAITSAQAVDPELQSAIEKALVKGRLPCAQAWKIADHAGLPRTAVSEACETLKIKISTCKLGAF